jgi:hypothetical protein
MSNTGKDDQLEFVREIASSPFWKAAYNELQLSINREKLAFAKELLKRAGIDENNIERPMGTDEDGEPICKTVEQYACSLLDASAEAIEYHEREIHKAYNNMALLKIMLARARYTAAEIDLVEIEAAQRKKLLG